MGQINRDFNMVTGKVKAVKFKAKPAPDRFENTHTTMMFIEGVMKDDGEGEICFLGNAKKDAIAGKDAGGNWTNVQAGHEVKFAYKENNGFYNYKSVEITGGSPVQSQGSSGGNVTQSQGKYDPNKPNPAEVGQAINLAVELKLAKKYDDLMDEVKVIEMIKSYKKAKQTFNDLWEKATLNEPQPLPLEEDDVPF